MAESGCVSDHDLKAFVLGELPERLAETVARHLELCPGCDARARRWDDVADGAIQALRGAAPPPTLAHDRTADPPTDPGAAAAVEPSSPPGFTLLTELGRGAGGVVYRARQQQPERVVALKCLRDGPNPGAEQRARFLAEADAIARLHHPHIVQVHAVGEHHGQPFLCLEYLAGGTLAGKIHGEPQPPREAARLLILLAGAVQHAHEQGVIHRDLKPANVLLTADGTPKVSDFGLARFGRPELTATGAIMGTPSYMAPEQARGDNAAVGPAADVWALGAILYELLTGRPPFRGVSVLDTLKQVAECEPVPPARLQPGVPRDLDVICLKCLEKNPAKRYGSAGELAEDLERFLGGRPTKARPVGRVERAWRWCRRNPAVAGLLAAVALVVVLGTATSWYLAVDALREKGRADAKTVEAEDNAAEARAKAREALDNEQKAQANAERAKANAAAAEANAAEVRRRLGELCVSNGVRLADEGDLFAALLWFAEPLVQDAGNPHAEAMARLRLAASWRYAPRPTLTQVLFHDGWVQYADFSADGRWVVTTSADGTARVWEAATGRPVRPPLKHQVTGFLAAFSPDGRRVLTVSQDFGARVWDAATGQPVGPPLQQQGPVRSAAFSPDGRRVVTGGFDGTARVWEAATGQPLGLPLKHQRLPGERPPWVEHAAFSPDGGRVVTASYDGTARVWDAATGQPLTPPLRHGVDVEHAEFSPDGRWVVSAGYDWTARVWDAATGQPVSPPLKHQGVVQHAAFSPDGRWVVTASFDHTARVWEAATGRPVSPPLKHQSEVWQAAFSPDGRCVVTASIDGTARVWEAATGQPLTPPLHHHGPVRHAAFSPDGRRVVTAGEDGTARVWDADVTREIPGRFERALGPTLRHQGRVWQAAFSPDGRRVVTASGEFNQPGEARVWETATGQPLGPPLKHGSHVPHADFSPDGRWVVTASADGTARVWDAATGQPVSPPLKHQRGVEHAAFSPDGRRVVTAGGDGSARVWDAATGQPVSPPLQHQGMVRRAAFSPDGRWVVTASPDYTARVWEADTGQPRGPPLKHQGPVWQAAFSPDGRWVVTASLDHTARVWESATGQPLGPPLQHQHQVQHAAFSLDGRRVVTASYDGTARVWEAATGRPASPPLQHRGPVYHAAFSPDGRRVVTASNDGTARVWEAATGQPLSPPLKHQGAVLHAAFSPDGRRVLTASSDGTARFWDLLPEERPREDLLRLVRVLAGHRLDSTGGFTPLTNQELRAAWQLLKTRYPQDVSASAEQPLAWHRRQADECEAAGEWFAARFHLGRLLEAEPANEALRRRRAHAAVVLADWQQASQDYARLPTSESNPEQACEYGSVLLLQGDQEGYRQLCRRLRQRFGQSHNPEELYLLGRLLALAPQQVTEPAEAVALAEKAVAVHPREAWYRHTLAVASYRAGRWAPAAEEAEKSMTDDPAWGGHVVNWLLLALAQQRQEQQAEARRWLDRAVQWLEQAGKANPGGAAGRLPVPSWADHLEVLLLRREAEQLLAKPPPGK
jgi:WD40 repeat protein